MTVWTLFLLTFCYPLVRRVCLGVARRALHSPQRLALFVALLFVVPLALIAGLDGSAGADAAVGLVEPVTCDAC